MFALLRFLPAGLACAGLLYAQTDASKGRILGTILDPQGRAVAAAQLTLTEAGTGLQRIVEANEAGQYQAIALNPGAYAVSVASAGFAAATIEGVVVNVGSAVQLDIPLRLEAAATEIDVSASLLDAAQPNSDAVVNSRAIANLPINGRRFHDFALLAPTVQVDRQRGQLSFVGQRGINSNVMVDGTDYNQPFFGGIRGGERSSSIITVPQSAIREFQVVPAGYTAEYGRSSGGLLNVTTKSGSNELHGDAFYQIRHRNLGAEDPFGSKVLETLRQTGGAIGGPIQRNRSFFFAAFERQTADTPREVEFPRLDDAAREAGPEAYDLFASLEKPFESTNDAWAFTPRTDWQLSGSQLLTVRYNASSALALNTSTTGDPRQSRTNRALSNNGVEEDRIHYGTAQLTSLLAPTRINELRLTLSREDRPRLNNSDTPLVQSAVGRFGSRSFLPTTQYDTRIQFNDSLSVTHGAHSMKAGLDYNRVTADQKFGFHQFGRFILFGSDVDQHLDCLSAGGAIANRFDCPGIYLRQIGNLRARMDLTQFAFFAQDNWRATPQLTLNFGVRWEAQFNPDPEATNADLLARVRDADLPFGRLDPARIPDVTDQIMPRFGFAYRPFADSNKTVLRGNAGIYYASTPLLLFAGPLNNFRETPGDLSLNVPTGAPTVYQQFLAAGTDLNRFPLNDLPVFSSEEIQRIAGGGGDPFAGAQLITAAADYRNPRSIALTAGIDHEAGRNLVLSANFHHINTVHLHRNRDFNLPFPVVRGDDPARIPFIDARRRPIASLGTLTVRESAARSLYRGFTASGKYRPGSRIQWDVHYTWSQTFSDDDNERSAVSLHYNDPFDLRGEYGPANQDIRHQLTSNAVVQLPFGISWAGIVRATSGPPINPAAGDDLNGDQASSDRGLAAPGVFLPRNAFRNRSLRNLDMRLMKNLAVTETAYFQLSAEFFNVLNLDNVEYAGFSTVYGPGVDPSTGTVVGPQPGFMRLLDESGRLDHNNRQVAGVSPFQVQFGVRFFF